MASPARAGWPHSAVTARPVQAGMPNAFACDAGITSQAVLPNSADAFRRDALPGSFTMKIPGPAAPARTVAVLDGPFWFCTTIVRLPPVAATEGISALICPAEAIKLTLGAGVPFTRTEIPFTCVAGNAERLSVEPNPVPMTEKNDPGANAPLVEKLATLPTLEMVGWPVNGCIPTTRI